MKETQKTLLPAGYRLFFVFCIFALMSMARADNAPCVSAFEYAIRNYPVLRKALERKAFQRYRADPTTIAIAEKIGDGKSVGITKPFDLTMQITETPEELRISLDFVGSRRDRKHIAAPKKSTLKDWINLYLAAMSAATNSNRKFERVADFDPTLSIVLTGLFQGIERRVHAKPGLKRVIVNAPTVQNQALQTVLVSRIGFKVIRPARSISNERGGIETLGSELELRLELERN